MARIPRYREIADDLRRRLAAGEWPVGSMMPGISALQEEYDVPGSLNTVRQAQAILLEEGLIEPMQGRGTVVIALPSPTGDPATLSQALSELQTALAATQVAITRVMRHLNPED